MEEAPTDHIEYHVAYSKIGVLFRVKDNNLAEPTYDKVYLPTNLPLLMIRDKVDSSSDGSQIYWPYFNVPVRLERQYKDEYTIAVVDHPYSNNILFYMPKDLLESKELFTSFENVSIDRSFDDDVNVEEFIQLMNSFVRI